MPATRIGPLATSKPIGAPAVSGVTTTPAGPTAKRLARRHRRGGRAGVALGGEVVLPVALERGLLALQGVVEELDGEVAERAAAELLAARVAGHRRAVGEGVRQDVAAVVADEDAVGSRLGRERLLEVRQPLVQREQRVGDALAEQHRDVEPAAVGDVPLGAVLLEELVEVRACRGPGPSATCRSTAPRTVPWTASGGSALMPAARQQADPLGPDRLRRGEAALQAPPGDLGGQRVEQRLLLVHQPAEGPDHLVATAVASHRSRRAAGRPCRPAGPS